MERTLLLDRIYDGRRMAADPSTRSGAPEDASAGAGPSTVRQKWTLTQEAFDRLLDSLGSDRDAAGARYLEIRRNLVRLFEWRGCPTPDEYADETINRCARKIGEGEEIRDAGTYCIGIARMLVREMSRDRSQQARPLEDAPEPRVQPAELELEPDRRAPCLRRCLDRLSPETRNLILHYYQGDKGDKIRNRKSLTELFGIPASTLRMRALRVRERLQLCAENCVARGPAEV
jgi:DNA-directed RNA polymerase specialized sigma24 family protein